MKYSLIVSDFDNTLANSERKVSAFTQNAISEYQKAGGKFMICTGRMFPSAREEAKLLGLSGDVICYNGAMIGDIESGKVSHSAFIKKEVALRIISEFENRNDVVVQLYFDDKIFVKRDNPYTREYCKECNLPFYETKISLFDFLSGQDKDIIEVLVMAEPKKVLELYQEYLQKGSKDYTVITSEAHFLEFISPLANKGIALRAYCEQNGIKPECVACFGDNYNDIFMIEYAGLGVAVENGVDELKKKADLVCPSNDDDGVAKIIEKITKGEI
ncbi:MAG: HAD family phosphatase [Clostridia bacterium]|nr:HAD family phosphatase [Clostridia bacterium]